MQKFTFDLPPTGPEPSLKNIPGLSRCPVPYQVVLRARRGSEARASAMKTEKVQDKLLTNRVLPCFG